MKALYCLACSDIRGLSPEGPVSCRCGRCHARWEDRRRGTAVFTETEPGGTEVSYNGNVRLLGIHNGVLWREPDYKAWEDADGYLFKRVESMIVNTTPGSTSDTRCTGYDEVFGQYEHRA